MVMVHQKAFKVKHKIADRWENTVYEVLERQDNMPISKICPRKDMDKSPKAIKMWIMHHNLLFPIAWTEENSEEDSDDDEDYPSMPVTRSQMGEDNLS